MNWFISSIFSKAILSTYLSVSISGECLVFSWNWIKFQILSMIVLCPSKMTTLQCLFQQLKDAKVIGKRSRLYCRYCNTVHWNFTRFSYGSAYACPAHELVIWLILYTLSSFPKALCESQLLLPFSNK